MESISPLWAGTPASHLSLQDSVEAKTLNILAFPAMRPKHRQVGGLSVFLRLFSNIAPSALSALRFSTAIQEAHVFPGTPSWWNSQNPDLLHTSPSFLLSPVCGTTFQRRFNHTVRSRITMQRCTHHLMSSLILIRNTLYRNSLYLQSTAFPFLSFIYLFVHFFACWAHLLPHSIETLLLQLFRKDTDTNPIPLFVEEKCKISDYKWWF